VAAEQRAQGTQRLVVAQLLGYGLTVGQVAAELGVTVADVRRLRRPAR